MKRIFVQKTLLSFLTIFIIVGLFGAVFVRRAEAQSIGTPGGAIGKAVGAGATCFLEGRLESFAEGLIFGEGPATAAAITKSIPAEAFRDVGLVINVPVLDNANFEMGRARLQSTEAGSYKNAVDQSLMKSKDCIRDVVAKIILDWIVDETVTWIQGGGKPGFVTNWENFAQDAVNIGVGSVIQETNLAFLCSPFKLQIQLSLMAPERFQHRIECTLDKIIANIDSFYDDFSQGGWLAYNTIWEPQNNYYGQILLIHDEAVVRAAQKKEAALNEALASKGFLSVKRCVEWNDDYIDYCKALGGTDDSCKKDAPACSRHEIMTPGDAVGRLAGEAITSDIRWAENIKSWTAALVNATMNRLIKEGLSLMKKSTDVSLDDYGSYNPWQGYDRLAQINKNAKMDLTEQIGKLVDDLSDIRTEKRVSLSYAEKTLQAFQDMKTKTCTPPITDAEIDNVSKAIAQLNGELLELDKLILLGDDLFKLISNMSDEEFASQSLSLQGSYLDLVARSGPLGTVQQAVNESAARQTEWETAQERSSKCS